jgi:hypothetical protein
MEILSLFLLNGQTCREKMSQICPVEIFSPRFKLKKPSNNQHTLVTDAERKMDNFTIGCSKYAY